MEEIVLVSKITVGRRISLTKEVCEILNIDVGNKITLIKNEAGDVIIRPVKVVA